VPAVNEYLIQIPRIGFTRLLALLVLILVANHVMLQAFHYYSEKGHWLVRALFDVDREDSLPTWCATVLLLLAAFLLYLIASAKSRVADRFLRHWWLLACGFLLLSIDEVAGLHESLNTVSEISWTKPAAVLLAVVGLIYLPFLWHLPRRTSIGFVVAGAIFCGGAVGVEHATDWYLELYSDDSFGYNLLTGVEEGLEMLGVVMFIGELLRYMNPVSHSARVAVEVKGPHDQPPVDSLG
jgi:hypothetical protein